MSEISSANTTTAKEWSDIAYEMWAMLCNSRHDGHGVMPDSSQAWQKQFETLRDRFHAALDGKLESSIPVIHTTEAELATDRFWFEHLVPITAAHGLPAPDQMTKDVKDPGTHLLLAPDGQLLAIVRTDRPACPTCRR